MYDGIDKLWLQHAELCNVSEPNYEHKSIQLTEIVESSFQLRNFAEIAVQLPKLIPRKKMLSADNGMRSNRDLLTGFMKWPKEILKVQKSTVSLKPIQKKPSKLAKLARPNMIKAEPETIKIEAGFMQTSQLPLAINKYIFFQSKIIDI